MAHRLLRDPEADGWERADMPIVCESCLGPNPFVRMQRIEYGGLCHISNRPYTVFRWKPGADARYKKTIVCQEVAKAKNVCQVCLLDLDYNLPVQVRDTALGLSNEDEPQSDVGKEFQLHQRVKEGENGSSFDESRPNDLLLRLQRTTPYYKRNEAKVCTFFAKGLCTRGAECPYRHEMPTTGDLANQNIKDRYYGINDPVANKMMRRVGDMPTLEPPEDKSIMTLFVGGVTQEMTEEDIRDHFYAFGELVSIRRVPAKNCAFITYSTRGAAEKAASELYGKLIIKGQRLRISWGKPQQPTDPAAAGGGGGGGGAAGGGGGGGGGGGAMGPPGGAGPSSGYGGYSMGYGAPPPGAPPSMLYPSMAKDQMGTRIGDKRQAGEEEGGPGDAAAGKRPRPPPGGPGGGGMPPPGGPGGYYGHPPPMHRPPPQQFWGGGGYGAAAGFGLAPGQGAGGPPSMMPPPQAAAAPPAAAAAAGGGPGAPPAAAP